MATLTCSIHPTPERELELERLGNEIAELAAHLTAATARLLDLIREFDARGGWGNGFSSCAAWLTWRWSRRWAVLMKALEAARETLYQQARRHDGSGDDVPAGTPTSPVPEEMLTAGQLQADALVLLAETALHHGMNTGTPAERYQVVVHVDAAVLADADAPGQSLLEGGARVPAETAQRLACDASRVVMRHDADGRIVEIGARTRTIPPALRRALHHRDRGCRFPGCGARFGQGHHIRHWAQGGPTTLSNLAVLCRRHHRAVHEEGYQMTRGADGELSFRTPHGWPLPAVPAADPVPVDPVDDLRAQNDAVGLRIDPYTAKPSWLGEPLDLGYAIDVLHPLALASLVN